MHFENRAMNPFGDIPNEFGAALHWDATRRDFLSAMGVMAGGLAAGFPMGAVAGPAVAPPQTASPAGAVSVEFHLNGGTRHLSLDPRVTLLDALRETLRLTGTKKGCDHGQCGACTVLVNGRRINSCLSLAVTHQGDEITTIEGLENGGDLHPMQAAFVECDGLQCGYCTPGQICSAVALLTEAQQGYASAVTADVTRLGEPELSLDEIRERMSGNICRCGAYPGIIEAVERVYRQGRTVSERRNLP